MRYWQADVNLGPALLTFGVRAEDRESAFGKALEVIGDRTALVELREILPLAQRELACR